jgi:PTS system mannose-specific IID component
MINRNIENRKINWIDIGNTIIRTFLIQCVWNFERYLNYGVAFALIPIMKRLYLKKDCPRALSRHMEYFNTHPYMASFIIGSIVHLESKNSKFKSKVHEEEISALKIGMMGPLAAIGDNLFWATIRPFCVLIALGFYFSEFYFQKNQYGFLIVPITFLVIYNFAHLYIRIDGFFQGYQHGDQVILVLKKYRFQRAIQGLHLLSLLLIGSLMIFMNNNPHQQDFKFFLIKILFFSGITGLFLFALHKKITPVHILYSIILLGMILAYWPRLRKSIMILHPSFQFSSIK